MAVWFSHSGSPMSGTELVQHHLLSILYEYEGADTVQDARKFNSAYDAANTSTIRAFNIGYMNPRTRVRLTKESE